MGKVKKRFLLLLLFAPLLLGAKVPVYNTLTPMYAPSGGVPVRVWSAETPTPGNGTTAASQQIMLQVQPTKAGTPFSVDGQFSGAPGSFEVDVQVAAIDSDTNYQTCSNCNITTVDSTNNTFHLDASGVTAKYVRLLMRSRGNSVSITATVTAG
jgi:hypothetical protein